MFFENFRKFSENENNLLSREKAYVRTADKFSKHGGNRVSLADIML